MRLHRNLVFAVIDTLHLVFNEEKYADKEISRTLKRDKRWGSRDRGFIAETTYDIVRWKRLYSEIADVKAPYTRANLFRIFTVWATLKAFKYQIGPNLKKHQQDELKGVLMNFHKLESSKNLYQIGLMNWVKKSSAKYGIKKSMPE